MNKPNRLVKFSIAIRTDTRTLIDKVSQNENRSRSALIDVVMVEYCKKQLNKDKP